MADRKHLRPRDKSEAVKPVSGSNEVAAFLARSKVVAKSNEKAGLAPVSGRLIFALDATMSRQPTWDVACSMQGELFDVAASHGGLATQLVYFRGTAECKASRWTRSSADMIRWMERFECRAGRTQLGRILQHVKNEAARQHIEAVVYVGDCLEEDPDVIIGYAGDIALRGIPLFVFQEGHDGLAQTVFREMVRLTGGAYGQFDGSARSKLAEYLKGIARFAASGGDRAQLPPDLRKQLPGPRR